VVVPLTKKVDEMFDFFQVNEVRAAVCLNEFGGVEGFITMRGVLNFIFGDISGGSKATAGYYAEKDYNIYEVPGDMKLNDFDNLTNFGIEDPRMTTVAGFAFRLLDRLPREGDKVEYEDIIIQILEMDDHRISRVRVAKGVDADDFDQEEGVIQAEKEVDPRAEDRDEIEDIPEDVDDTVEYEPEDEADLVEKVS
jgi:CBS domain containing-hemolysin-like protein